MSPESPITPPTVRLRKKAYSDLSPIPLLSLSTDEESPTHSPASTSARLTTETEARHRVHRTHSLPSEKRDTLRANAPKLELSRKYSYPAVLIYNKKKRVFDMKCYIHAFKNQGVVCKGSDKYELKP